MPFLTLTKLILGLRTWTKQEPQGHRIKTQRNKPEPQRTETKDRTHRTHRPQPLKNLPGITTIPTTMPQNTVISKAPTGPFNTLDNETIIVSNP